MSYCSVQCYSISKARIAWISLKISKHANSKSNLNVSWFPRRYFSSVIALSLPSIILAPVTRELQFLTPKAIDWFGCTWMHGFPVDFRSWYVQWSIHKTYRYVALVLPSSQRPFRKKLIDCAKILTNGRADANAKKKKVFPDDKCKLSLAINRTANLTV